MTITVTTQVELDAALESGTDDIEIRSPKGEWLSVRDTGDRYVYASGSSTVTAYGSSTVTASGSSTVTASGSSTVRAYGSSTVTASGSSTVRAYDSSTVTASGSSTVTAYGSSTVTASKYVAVHKMPYHWGSITGGVVIEPRDPDEITEVMEWAEHYGIETVETDGGPALVVFKGVDSDYMSEYNGGISYAPGTLPEAPDWMAVRSCGNGLHFSPTPTHTHNYASGAERYLRCVVLVAETVPLGDKVKAKRVVAPLVEVDEHLREVVREPAEATE